MERQRFVRLRRLLRQVHHTHRDPPRCLFGDDVILLVMLWAVLHDRSIHWASQHHNWPGDLRPRGGLPSQSQMSRRQHSHGVCALIDKLDALLRSQLPRDSVKVVDARPLPVGGCSKDPDAADGFGAGRIQRGYRLTQLANLRGVVEAWWVTPMNVNEVDALEKMLPHVKDAAVVLGDGQFDVNRCFDMVAFHTGGRLIALPRKPDAKALGHREHHPDREANFAYIRTPQGKLLARRMRSQIERVNGWQGQRDINLRQLPHHVRRAHRVRLFVALKRVLYHDWLSQTPSIRTLLDGVHA